MPYRITEREEDAAAADVGLVADVVRQFADPFAFYRELAQNALDAGTQAVHVHLLVVPRAEGHALIRASVRDDGTGMSREVLEKRLVVLFRSSKEGRRDAIGKFGIGFVSVLAVQPERVVVDTSHDGTRHVLHLFPDHRYELFEMGASDSRGTTVTLEIPMPETDVVSFVERSQAALERWCAHTRVAVRLEALREDGTTLVSTRIDRPFGVTGLVCVTCVRGDTQIAAAIVGAPDTKTRFYNRGLLLAEEKGRRSHLEVKVDDPNLAHTVSRDGTRQDMAYYEVLAKIEEVVACELAEAGARAIDRALEEDDFGEYLRLVTAMTQAAVGKLRTELRVPLATSTRRTTRLGSLLSSGPILTAPEASPLTDALAARDVSVVRAFVRGSDRGESMKIALCDLTSRVVENAADHYTLVTAIEGNPADFAMLDVVRDAFELGHRAPPHVVLAQFEGRCANRLFLPVSEALALGQVKWHLLDAEGDDASPFRLLFPPSMAISIAAKQVVHARQLAETDPEIAGTLLARILMVDVGALSDRGDRKMSERAIARVLGEEP